MLLSALLAIFSLSLVAAQDQVIQVGATTGAPNDVSFTPNNITAGAGSVITFNFSANPGVHSVTQTSFDLPCDLLHGGFDSGFVGAGSLGHGTAAPVLQWNLTITNTTMPIWFYCKQLVPVSHCHSGMVGAINAPLNGDKTFEAFQSAAELKDLTGPSGQGEGGIDASIVPSIIPFSSLPRPLPVPSIFGTNSQTPSSYIPATGPPTVNSVSDTRSRTRSSSPTADKTATSASASSTTVTPLGAATPIVTSPVVATASQVSASAVVSTAPSSAKPLMREGARVLVVVLTIFAFAFV